MTLLDNHLSLLAQRGVLAPKEIEEAAPSPFPRDRVETVDLQGVELLFVLGVGDASIYHQVGEWLTEGRFLVFLEPDPGALRSWLEEESATEVLQNPKVKFFLCHTEAKRRIVINWCRSYFAGLASRFVALPTYRDRFPELCDELSSQLGSQSFLTSLILQELLQNCAHSFDSIYSNLRALPKSGWANELYGRFQGIPAIICGAGPSLEKQLPLLEELQDRALIFAPGSAVEALSKHAIQPHFCVGIDPNPEQFALMAESCSFELPILYGSRWRKGILSRWHGPKLFISGLNVHKIERWFEEELGIKTETMEGGHSASQIALEIARQMGCSKLILIGQDLAYTGGSLYASGVGEALLPADLNHFHEKPVIRTNLWGEEVTTAWKWLVEARWFTHFQERFPEIQLINASEGGLGIEGITHRPLNEIDLSEIRPLHELVWREVARAHLPSQVTKEAIDQLLARIKEGLDRTEEIAKDLIEEIDRGIDAPLRSGRAALLESDLQEEIPYSLIFEGLLQSASITLTRRLEEMKSLSDEERRIEERKIDRSKIEFVLQGVEIHKAVLK